MRAARLVPAKTTPPSVAGALARLRLFRLLDRSRRPITWVWGPPGAGKTTLVAGYLAKRKLRRLWYHIDAGDADVATLFYYLGRSVGTRRSPLPLLTPEYRRHLERFARSYFRELYRRLRAPFVVVFDSYQDAPDAALLHDILPLAAEELPQQGRLIVTSRVEPPASLARLRVHQGVESIGWPELRLTRTEAAGLARRFGSPQPPATIRSLCDRADGWIAGLLLLLEQGVTEPPVSSRPESSQLLFDYFAGEILRKTSSRARNVLLQTAFLPSVTEDMADALTGRPRAGQVVAELHRRNYFTTKRGGSEKTYQYHPLFREFLLTQARRTFSAERVAAICRTAAGLVEGAGQADAAAELLCEAHEPEGLGGLVCRNAATFLSQGRVETVERWLANVPETTFADMPWLLCWRSLCSLGRNHEACCRDAERALSALREQQDVDGALFAWSLIVSSHVMAGWLASVDTWIARLDDLIAESPRPASHDIQARVAAAMLMAIAFRQPNHPRAAHWAVRAVELTRSHPDLTLRTLAASGWFFYHSERGEAAKASVVIEDMRAIARRLDIPSVVALQATLPLVWHALLWASPSYRRTIVEMREHARATGLHHVLSTALLGHGALAALSDGDLDTAGTWIREFAEEAAEWGPTYELAYHGLAALEALARGDLDGASTRERGMARRGYTSGVPKEEALARVVAAYVWHERGAEDEVRAHLERALGIAATIRSPYLEWIARLAQAYVLLDRNQDALGLEALGMALALGRAGGYVNSEVWRPAVMARLCVRALEAGIEVSYVQHLVKRRLLVCDPPPVAVESWPWAVKVFTLGRFAVMVAGRPLRFAGKVQRKPLALLKAVIALGNPGVREERLMDLLWPDSEGDAAQRALTSAVFRLRRLLGQDAALVRGDGEIRLDPAHCWVDVWAVQHLLDRADVATEGDERGWAEKTRWTERAAELYRGPFLGTSDGFARSGDASQPLRRRLLRQLPLVARHWEAAGNLQKAADLLEAALGIDPCAERDACRLMTVYHQLGRPAEARAAYRQCRDALEQHLGVPPSAEMEAVLTSLRANRRALNPPGDA